MRGLYVSGDFFATLGVTPLLGRVFTHADDSVGCGVPGAVISHDFWQREFDGDTSVIGRTLTLETHKVDIIGVTPAGFFGPEVGRTFDVAVPICSVDAIRPPVDRLKSGSMWWLTMIGRLKPDWTIERADAHVRALSAGIFKDALPPGYPQVSVQAYLASKFTAVPAGAGYLDAALLLFAIAAAAAGDDRPRAAGRVRESGEPDDHARRRAKPRAGAAPGARRVARTAAVTVVVREPAARGRERDRRARARARVEPDAGRDDQHVADRFMLELTPDWRVFAFTAGVAVLTCLVVGLAPALRATRGSPGDVLKSSSRGSTRDHESLGLRRALVVVQVAVSLVLVVGALLFVRSFNNLIAAPMGFQQQNVLIVEAACRRRGRRWKWRPRFGTRWWSGCARCRAWRTPPRRTSCR